MLESSNETVDEREVIAALVGTLLGERYRLERVLGAGGMGAVFEGKDLRLERPVAIKVMQPSYAGDPEYVKRFLREARAASKIRHRNVVVVLDYGQAEGRLVYSVMELLAGQDLEEHLRGQPGQRMAWERACGLLMQIASGLRAAHGQGVIHRDIKPANCFLTAEDDEMVVKVVDFGIAKLGESQGTQQLTGTGNVLGTPSYTAPEMVLLGGPASPRSDVYSLGVVAYRMLTGRLPFTGKTAFEVMHHACIDPVPGMHEHEVDVPVAVEALVLEMLAKKPEERPADMGEVRQRLAALGREVGGVQAVEEGVGSSSLRIEVGGAGTSGVESEVTRTEVLDSGNREPKSSNPSGRTAGADAVAAEAERTEVMIGAGFREPSGQPLAAPVVEWKQVLDSGVVARPQRKVAGWLVGGGVIVAAAIGGVTWGMMMKGGAPEAAPKHSIPSGATVVEPEPKAVLADPVEDVIEPKVDAKAVVVPIEPAEPDVEPIEPVEPVVEELPTVAKPEEPTQVPEGEKPRDHKTPAALPTDTEVKKKLTRKIESKCGAEMAGKSVTVSFLVNGRGVPNLVTATPRNAAGECAKQQVEGMKFRARKGETPMKIVVE